MPAAKKKANAAEQPENENEPPAQKRRVSLAERIAGMSNTDGVFNLVLRAFELTAQKDVTLKNGVQVIKGTPNGVSIQGVLSKDGYTGANGSEAAAAKLKMIEGVLKTNKNKLGQSECFGKPIWIKPIGDGTATITVPVCDGIAVKHVVNALKGVFKDVDDQLPTEDGWMEAFERYASKIDIQPGDIGNGPILLIEGDTYGHRHALLKLGATYNWKLQGYTVLKSKMQEVQCMFDTKFIHVTMHDE